MEILGDSSEWKLVRDAEAESVERCEGEDDEVEIVKWRQGDEARRSTRGRISRGFVVIMKSSMRCIAKLQPNVMLPENS